MDLAPYHPQIVHFVIALYYVGLAFRVVSLSGRLAWTRPAGATLLILAALASVAAAKSGDAAHGPAERIPGAREMVQHHEERGEQARNLLLALAAIEVVGLALSRKERLQRAVHAVAAAGGLLVGFHLYEAAEHGGQVVYEYGGGVGTRRGDTTHIRQTLVAGLYHQSMADRAAGRAEQAARLIEEMGRRVPGDTTVALLVIESILQDRGDAQAALDALAALHVAPDNDRLAVRHGLLTAQALTAAGRSDSARAVLGTLAERFPQNNAVRQALERAGGS